MNKIVGACVKATSTLKYVYNEEPLGTLFIQQQQRTKQTENSRNIATTSYTKCRVCIDKYMYECNV